MAMNTKTKVIEAIRGLPAKATMQDIYEKVAFMAAVQEGLDELKRGERIPISKVEAKIGSWASRSSSPQGRRKTSKKS